MYSQLRTQQPESSPFDIDRIVDITIMVYAAFRTIPFPDEKKFVGLTSEWKPNDYYESSPNLFVMDGVLTLSAQVPEPA